MNVKHANPSFRFEEEVYFKSGVCSLDEFSRKCMLLRSHKFENNYDMVSEVNHDVENGVFVLRVNHGS